MRHVNNSQLNFYRFYISSFILTIISSCAPPLLERGSSCDSDYIFNINTLKDNSRGDPTLYNAVSIAGDAQLRHSGSVLSVVYSKNGNIIMSGGIDGTIRMWNVNDFMQIHKIEGINGDRILLAISPDGKYMAYAGRVDNKIRLLNLSNRTEVLLFGWHVSSVTALTFSRNGKTMASASSNGAIHIWDTATGRELLQYNGNTKTVSSIAFSPDSNTLTFGCWDGSICFLDVTSKKKPLRIIVGNTRVLSVVYSLDGKKLFSGNDNGIIHEWDAISGEMLSNYSKSVGPINVIILSPDGKTLAAGGDDAYIYLWDALTGRKLINIHSCQEWLDMALFLPQSPTGTLPDILPSINCLAFSPDSKEIAVGRRDGRIQIFNVATGKERSENNKCNLHIKSIVLSPNGMKLASMNSDGSIRLVSTITGGDLLIVKRNDEYYDYASFTPDGNKIAFAGFKVSTRKSIETSIHLISTLNGKEYWNISGLNDLITCIAFSRDGKALAAAEGNIIRLREISTGKELKKYVGNKDNIKIVSFSLSGDKLYSWGRDGKIRIWDISSELELNRIEESKDYFNVCALDESALSYAFMQIHLYDIEKHISQTLKGCAPPVNALALSSKGNILASGCDDKSIYMWNTATGDLICKIDKYKEIANSIAFSADGKYMASSFMNSKIIIWQVDSIVSKRE